MFGNRECSNAASSFKRLSAQHETSKNRRDPSTHCGPYLLELWAAVRGLHIWIWSSAGRTRGTMAWPGWWHEPEAAHLLFPSDGKWAFFSEAVAEIGVNRLAIRAKDLRSPVLPGAELGRDDGLVVNGGFSPCPQCCDQRRPEDY